jgi:phosphate starvation-inducible PhoH-like protein
MAKKKQKHSQQPVDTTAYNSPQSNQEKDTDESDHIKIRKLEIKFRTQAQEELWNLLDQKEIVICAGSAGTGKSHISILKALDLLSKQPEKYKRIIITTPILEADGERMGFLPGTADEKMGPYIYSSIYLFEKILGKQKVERMRQREHIFPIALAYMRGINVDNSILICDEAQNLTPKTMKTLLTRIGENSKFILNGDLSQSDRCKDHKDNGLFFAMEKLQNIDEIGIFEFEDKDIIRNPIIGKILKRFNGDIQ